jgi:murein DD-endopeptidase MepM/ murein hydrolase activator NlpD
MRGGTVTSITTYPHNCYGLANCEACGLGVIITDEQGVQWTYCHGSAHRVNQGDTVAAGQQILDSGNSGNSSGPHLHLGIRTNGVARCPQPLVASLYEHGVGLDPMTLPTTGCSY